MNRPNTQKVEKRYTPVDNHRRRIGEYNKKVQDKLEKKEPLKMNEIEINEGTKILKFVLLMIGICLIFLALSLFI